MKNKIIANSHSQNSHLTSVNNGSISSNRARNPPRGVNNKFSSIPTPSKVIKNKNNINNNNNNENELCNNNDEELNIEGDSSLISDTSLVKDSINNNNIIEVQLGTDCENLIEDFNNLSIKSPGSVDSCDSNLNGNFSLSNDEEGNENNGEIDDECRKSSGSVLENRTNLIVNYLPQNMSQEEMRILFSNIGEVESCKLIRDKTTGQSLSYGFVNYQDPKDASTAIHQFNGLRLQNKVIKVSLARPSSETIKGANLYICGLPKSMNQIELEDIFAQYGTIITCRILLDNVTGNSKGVAFIRFDQRHEAETAIKKLNGHTPPNGTEAITVKLANTPFNINNSSNLQLSMQHNQNNDFSTMSSSNSNAIPSSNPVRCMMPNMRPLVTTCSDIIPRLDVVLQSNGHCSSSVMGNDYVQSSNGPLINNHQMPYPTGQMVCQQQLHPIATFPMSYQGIHHPCLQPMAGPPGPPPVPTNSLVPTNNSHHSSQYLSIDPMSASAHIIDSNFCCLIIYNLSPEAKEGSLWQTFGPYGAVHSVGIVRDPATGKCRGIGYVTMPNYHEAMLAAQNLNGNPLDNHILQIVLNPSLKMPTINQYVLPSVAP